MSSLNKVTLIGNTCQDPEVRALPNGSKVANFTLATNISFKTKEGKKVDETEFHKLVLWRGLAEVCEKFVRKGKQIYIEGKLKTRKWKDKEDNDRYTTEIVCDQLLLIGSKGGDSGSFDKPASTPSENSGYATPENAYPSGNSEEDDLPF